MIPQGTISMPQGGPLVDALASRGSEYPPLGDPLGDPWGIPQGIPSGILGSIPRGIP